MAAFTLLMLALGQSDMGPLMPDTTLLDGCPLNPGESSPCAMDIGVRADEQACLAACASASYCSGMTFHGPTTQEWANHCVFRIDDVYAPRACGAGCDHTSANKTSGWEPQPPPPLPTWLPALLPWGKPKVFWFGANASGLDSEDTLALLARHAVAGYGWQTGHQGGGTPGVGEELQAAAATHLSDYLDAVGNNSTAIFEYRQIQVALRLFAQCAMAADDATKDAFWLHDAKTGELCLAGQPWGTADPYWNFSHAPAADYWVSAVIGELATDRALTSGRGAVFWDESDQGECGYRGGNCDFSAFPAAALQAAKNAVYARQAAAMNAAGIIPIFSLDNRFEASGTGTSAPAPCALPEDALAAALNATRWVRFYENWPQSFWVPGGKDLSAAMVSNVRALAQLALWQGRCASPPPLNPPPLTPHFIILPRPSLRLQLAYLMCSILAPPALRPSATLRARGGWAATWSGLWGCIWWWRGQAPPSPFPTTGMMRTFAGAQSSTWILVSRWGMPCA